MVPITEKSGGPSLRDGLDHMAAISDRSMSMDNQVRASDISIEA